MSNRVEMSKQRYRGGSLKRSQSQQLPSLSYHTPIIPPQVHPPSVHVPSPRGRGLLSRALAMGELDQFLVTFFSDPENVQFARGKVEERRRRIAALAHKNRKLGSKRNVHIDVLEQGQSHVSSKKNTSESDSASTASIKPSERNHRTGLVDIKHGSFGPVLTDYGGQVTPSWRADEVSELGSASEFGGRGRQGELSDADSSVCSHGSLASLNSNGTVTKFSLGSACTSSITEESARARKCRLQCRNRDTPKPCLDNTHFEGHLLHRVCGVTGKFPGSGSKHCSEPQDSSSKWSLLEDSGEEQLARLRRSPEIMSVLHKLKALSVSLLDPEVGAWPAKTGGSGGGGCGIVRWGPEAMRIAKDGYLELFEEMLLTLLRMQREKSKIERAKKSAMQRELQLAREKKVEMAELADMHSKQLEALHTVKQALSTEVKIQEAQLEHLAVEAESRDRMDRVAKEEHIAGEAQKKSLLQSFKEEEQSLRTRFKEVEVEVLKAETEVRSMEHLQAKVERTAKLNKQIYRIDETKYKLIPESKVCFSQTVANDDGLWDFQDGCTKEISRSVLQRIRWQAYRRFASCPFCRGVGAGMNVKKKGHKGWTLSPSKDMAAEDPTLLHHQKRKAKNSLDRFWTMPNVLIQFMSHLPRTSQALPIKSLRWLTREMWLILDERERVDAVDEQEGQHKQNMNDFMVELFLRRCSLRKDAELQLYIFLISLKAHYRKSAAAHTFARLMDLLDDGGSPSSDSTTATHHDQREKKENGRSRAVGGHHAYPEHSKREEELLEEEVLPKNAPLGTAFLPLLLFTRRALLKKPKVDLEAMCRERIANRFSRGMAAICVQQTVLSAFTQTKNEGKAVSPSATHSRSEDEPDVSSSATATSARPAVVGSTSLRDKTTSAEKEVAIEDGASSKQKSGVCLAELPEGSKTPFPSDQEASNSIVEMPGTEDGGYTGGTEAEAGKNMIQSVGRAVTLDSATSASRKAATIGGETQTWKDDARQQVTDHHSNSGKQRSSRQHVKKSNAKNKGGKRRKSAMKPTGEGMDEDKGRIRRSSTVKPTGDGMDEDSGGKRRNSVLMKGLEDAAVEHLRGGGAVEDDGGHREVSSFLLPGHLVTEDQCTFWVSMDLVVRVLTVVLSWCPAMKRHAYIRSLERKAALLTSRGHITGVEACHSYIRSAMRKTIAAVEAEIGISDDISPSAGSPDENYNHNHSHSNHHPGGTGGSNDAGSCSDVPKDARVVFDMARVIELVMEVLLLRQHSIERRLRALFTEGDTNGDGVLSFEEFNDIIARAAPHFSERRVLRMFREALTNGSEGSYAIEKETFCKVCRQHGLVQIIDIDRLEVAAERGNLCGSTVPLWEDGQRHTHSHNDYETPSQDTNRHRRQSLLRC